MARLVYSIVLWDTAIVGAVVQLVEYRTRNKEVEGSIHTLSSASNLEQVANLLYAQANLASLLPSAGREMSSSYGYGLKAYCGWLEWWCVC